MNLRRRLTGLLFDPKREWSIIAGEPVDATWLYRNFIVVVAAIPPVALLLRFTIAGAPVLGVSAAATRYIVALAMPVAAAVIIEKLAPRFHSRGNTATALKLVAYSAAPVWVAGVFSLLPMLGGTATLVGILYGIYLFALGLPRILHTPREQLVPFMLVCAILFLVINTAFALLTSRAF